MLFVLGCFLILVGIILGVLGKILGIHSMENFGNTAGGIGIVLSIVGFMIH